MAELTRQGDELVLSLTHTERIEAIHSEVRVPLSSVRAVEVLDDVLAAVHGVRSPGLGFPGLVAVGTFKQRGARTFAVVHHGHPGGVRIRLAGADYDELIVGCEDPGRVAARLTEPSRSPTEQGSSNDSHRPRSRPDHEP